MAINIVTENIPHLTKLLISIVSGFHLRTRKLFGRQYIYSEKTITKAFIVMVYFRLRSLRGLARFLSEHHDFAYACGLKGITPSYRTLSRRLKTLDSSLWYFIYQVIAVLVKYHIVSFNIISTDSSLLEAKGKPSQKINSNIIPTDKDAKWGFSQSRDWVFGYKIHLTSTVLLKNKTSIPLAWIITPANRHDSKLFIPLMKNATNIALAFKKRIYFSLGDKGYDHNENYYFCSKKNIRLVTTIRRFKKKAISKIKLWAKCFVDSFESKALYQRRADNECLFSQIKNVFLIDHLPVIYLLLV